MDEHDQDRWVVYDDQGVITETGDETEAREAFYDQMEFTGDLVLARIEERRR